MTSDWLVFRSVFWAANIRNYSSNISRAVSDWSIFDGPQNRWWWGRGAEEINLSLKVLEKCPKSEEKVTTYAATNKKKCQEFTFIVTVPAKHQGFSLPTTVVLERLPSMQAKLNVRIQPLYTRYSLPSQSRGAVLPHCPKRARQNMWNLIWEAELRRWDFTNIERLIKKWLAGAGLVV